MSQLTIKKNVQESLNPAVEAAKKNRMALLILLIY